MFASIVEVTINKSRKRNIKNGTCSLATDVFEVSEEKKPEMNEEINWFGNCTKTI